MSLKFHHVGHPLSNLRLCYLPHVSYLSNEGCAHRVHVYCYLFTESSSCRRSFFNWATPVKLCRSVFYILIDCLLHQFLGSIQERVRVPHRKHHMMSSTSWNSRLSTCVFACQLSRLLRAGLTIFVKRCCTISRTSFTSSEPVALWSLASLRENPIRYLPPRSCGKTPLGLRLISACVRLLMSYHRTPCRLPSHCLSQLGTSRHNT